MTDPEPAYVQRILDHYRHEAEIHGTDASSTMKDTITRGREVAAVQRLMDYLLARHPLISRVLDVGCGNGYLLSVLRNQFPRLTLSGLEYTPEFVDLARQRALVDCSIIQGDVRKLPLEDATWDVVVTERCIINVMDPKDQGVSFAEVARVLKPGGYFICIEAFTDGLEQLNEARMELGLPPNQQPHHNVWFDKDWFLETVLRHFKIVDVSVEGDPSLPPPNFLSSHYFISRALYPSITKREVLYNTHLVRFFSFLPPIGNYSPIQLHLLRRV